MRMKSLWAPAVVAVLAVYVGACANAQDASEIKTKINEIQAGQKDILAKLEALKTGQKQIQVAGKAPARAAKPAEDPNKVYDVKVGNSYVKGPEDAKVTIIEFSDFQCPFCSQAAALVKQVTDAYPKDVKVVYKNYPLPFHKEAMPAAKAAIAAGKQGKFWDMHDKLFANYRNLGEEFFAKAAEDIGLDVAKFKADMASPEVQALVSAEMKEAQAAGVRGTPTFFINGKKPQGRSFELYKGIIDGILNG